MFGEPGRPKTGGLSGPPETKVRRISAAGSQLREARVFTTDGVRSGAGGCEGLICPLPWGCHVDPREAEPNQSEAGRIL